MKQLIQVLLKDPLFPEKIRQASVEDLASWIQAVGLEDAGEIVAFAGLSQIEALFDQDLWKSKSKGGDESFDVERFGVWLSILCEVGFKKAADKIVEMDEDFLVMAFSELAWVVDTEWLAESCEVKPAIEKIIESRLMFEVDQFTLFAKQETSWDTFISLLVDMDSHHHRDLYRILERCSDLLAEEINSEDDLYHLLRSTGEQLVDDVAYEREKRREAQGFVTPAVARSFLKFCEEEEGSAGPDHVTPRHLLLAPAENPKMQQNFLKSTGALTTSPRFIKVIAVFQKYTQHENLFLEQIHYLANLLMAGWTWPGEERRPGRALEIVLEVCEEGLSSEPEKFSSFPQAFRSGWKRWRTQR